MGTARPSRLTPTPQIPIYDTSGFAWVRNKLGSMCPDPRCMVYGHAYELAASTGIRLSEEPRCTRLDGPAPRTFGPPVPLLLRRRLEQAGKAGFDTARGRAIRLWNERRRRVRPPGRRYQRHHGGLADAPGSHPFRSGPSRGIRCMACAYAKWTGGLHVCLATSGPGGRIS